MKAVQPSLNFDGNTRDAMTFYQKCIDGELTIQTFGDVKAPGPPGTEDGVMHARLSKGSAVPMASNTMPLADQFWGARFGMLTDKFRINWMFNCETKKPG